MKQKTTWGTSKALFHLVLWSQGGVVTDSRGDLPVCSADCCTDWLSLSLCLSLSIYLSCTHRLFLSLAFPPPSPLSLSLSVDICHLQRRFGFRINMIMCWDKETRKCQTSYTKRYCFLSFLGGQDFHNAVLFLCTNAASGSGQFWQGAALQRYIFLEQTWCILAWREVFF